MSEASACNALMLLLRQSILAGEGHKAAKLRVKQQKVAGVAKVIGVSKLKGKYEPFEAKRQLCNSYDLFIADDRVVPSLPKLIGMHRATACLSRHILFEILSASVLFGDHMHGIPSVHAASALLSTFGIPIQECAVYMCETATCTCHK